MRRLILFFGLVCDLAWAADQTIVSLLENAERAIRAEPESEANRVALATLYLQIGRNRPAVDTLHGYLDHHAGAASTLRLLALANIRLEDYGSAKDAALLAVKAAPKDAAAVHLLGMAELGLQDTKAAELSFRRSLELDPDSVDSGFQLALLYTRKREHLVEAVALLNHARSKQPSYAGIHMALGSALLELDKPKDAVESLEAAVKVTPDSTESWYLLADAYRRLHEDGKADQALKTFRDLNNALADQRAREMRGRAWYEEAVGILKDATDAASLEKAFELCNRAIHEMPALDAGYYRLAQIGYLRGNAKGALAFIAEAIRINPLEPEYYFVEAKCLEGIDRPAALISARKAVALRPGVSDFEELLQDLKKND